MSTHKYQTFYNRINWGAFWQTSSSPLQILLNYGICNTPRMTSLISIHYSLYDFIWQHKSFYFLFILFYFIIFFYFYLFIYFYFLFIFFFCCWDVKFNTMGRNVA